MGVSKYILCITFLFLATSCKPKLDEKESVFYASFIEGGVSSVFFSLYKNGQYKFCDGDFMDPNCYIGEYELSGDTIVFEDLIMSEHVRNNKFLICRYKEQDSSYWKKKYPDSHSSWEYLKDMDKKEGVVGDLFELDILNRPKIDLKKYYLIRIDSLSE